MEGACVAAFGTAEVASVVEEAQRERAVAAVACGVEDRSGGGIRRRW